MENINVISKGSYSTFRFNDFVSVRQYLLIREKGKKYLILKLSNDASETVTGLKLKVEQLDVRGVCIATSYIDWTGLQGASGSKFISPEKIPLKENCVEVKVNLIGATYGEYTYEVKSNELVVTYDKKVAKRDVDYSEKTYGERVVTRERKFRRPLSVIAASLAVILCILVATMVQVYNFKRIERRFSWKGMEYEFVTDNKEDGAPIRIVGYSGNQANLVVPATMEGYTITGIASEAFRGNLTLQSLKVEADVEILNYAFEKCVNLETVELVNVTKIGQNAFSKCTSLRSVKAEGLREIGRRAFSDCQNLTSLELSDEEQVLSLGSESFANCTRLETITIDQPTKYPSAVDMFRGVSSVRELKLHNYNSALYEERTNKTLTEFFYGTKPYYLTSVTIEDIDAIPKQFALNVEALQTATLSGLKNVKLGERAFYRCNELANLSITFEEEGQGFTEVEDSALYGTKIPTFEGKYLTKIGDYAFAGNTKLTTVNVTNETELTELGEGAFQDCNALTSFHVSGIVPAILADTFDGCSSLTALEMGEGIEEIGDNAFNGCSSLTELKIPSTVKVIGLNVLKDCTSLKTLETPYAGSTVGAQPYLAAMFGASYAEESGVVPETLQTVTVTGDYNIAEKAFYNLSNLKQVSLQGKVETIGYSAFQYCSNLRELRLSVDLKSIGENAFAECYLLFEVWNLSGLPIELGENTYGGVAKYALAVYEASHERGDVADQDGFKLLKDDNGWYLIDYVGDSTEWNLPKYFKNKAGTTLREYHIVDHLFEGRSDVATLSIPTAVKSMGSRAFASCTALTKVVYEENGSLTEIPDHAYEYCSALTTVEILASSPIENIQNNAFFGCSSLQTIGLPNGLRSIGNYAFGECTSLKSLVVGDNVERMGVGMLYGVTSLNSLTIPFIGETRTENQNFAILFDEWRDGSHVQTLEKVVVTSVSTIPAYAFYRFEGLKSIVFKSEVSTVGEAAFSECYALQTVTFKGAVERIEDYAFSSCSKLSTVSLLEGLTSIGNYAFYCAGLQTITLPQSLVSIGSEAFRATKLKNITIPTELQTMGSYVFAENSNLQSVNMNGCSLMEIPYATFYNCSGLTQINLNSSDIEAIGSYAFANTGLTNIDFPAELRTIEYNAFASSALTSVYISGDVRYIDESAFNSCTALQTVEIYAEDLEYISNYTFAYCTALKTVKLGYGIREIYESAFRGCSALETVILPETLGYINYDAFYGCVKLYEVFNLSGLSLTRGTTDYGYIGYYAVIIHDSLNDASLQQATVNGLIFKYASSEREACVIGYEGTLPQSLTFQAVTLGGYTYNSYWIYRNVFDYESGLTEVNTGVVNEINENAFYGCENLRKVTLGSNLYNVKSDAFGACTKLWEVWDDSNTYYNLSAGDYWSCGRVAYYAVAINTPITYSTQGDFKFMKINGTSYLYGYTGSYYSSVTLPDMAESYVVFVHPQLGSELSSIYNYVVIPTSVSYIQNGAFDYYLSYIYYKGTASQWASIASGLYTYASVYYYSDCVHNAYFGTRNWRYDNGTPTTMDTNLTYTKDDATCQKTGLEVWTCEICKQTIHENFLNKKSHSYTSANGGCTWCGQVPAAYNALGNLVEVQNNGSYKFLINNNKELYSDWREDYDDYGGYNVWVDIVANANVKMKFTLSWNCAKNGYCAVYVTNKEDITYIGQTATIIELDLNEGDVVTIEIYNPYNNSSSQTEENRVYIKNITVTEIKQEEKEEK